MSRSGRRRALPIAVLALATLLGAAGCTSGSTASASPVASGAGASGDGVHIVTIHLTNDGCAANPSTVPAGAAQFNISNDGGDAVSEVELLLGDRILAEKENLAPGLSGSFSLELEPGTYEVECPGATTSSSPFTVTAAG